MPAAHIRAYHEVGAGASERKGVGCHPVVHGGDDIPRDCVKDFLGRNEVRVVRAGEGTVGRRQSMPDRYEPLLPGRLLR